MNLKKATGFLLVVLTFFTLNTASVEAALIGTKQEISMGKPVAKQLEDKYGLVEDEALQARINEIGMKMVKICERKDLPYTFKVLNSDDVNAVAVPGGFIYVYKGLTDLMKTDDELAGVIGHELGHIVERHSVHQMEKTLGMTLLLGGLFKDNSVVLQSLALNVIMAGYSRSDEKEADHLGFVHSTKAGYNPYGMLIGLMKLSSLNPDQKNSWFSTHPEGKTRIELAKKDLTAAGIKPTVNQTATEIKVVDGAWQLPAIKADAGGTEAIYRAYLIAGRIYQAGLDLQYNNNKYILDSDGVNLIIYYDNQIVMTVTEDDASAYNMNIYETANMYMDALRNWKK